MNGRKAHLLLGLDPSDPHHREGVRGIGRVVEDRRLPYAGLAPDDQGAAHPGSGSAQDGVDRSKLDVSSDQFDRASFAVRGAGLPRPGAPHRSENYAFRVIPRLGEHPYPRSMSWLPPTVVCICLVVGSATAWLAARTRSNIRDLAVVPVKTDAHNRRKSP